MVKRKRKSHSQRKPTAAKSQRRKHSKTKGKRSTEDRAGLQTETLALTQTLQSCVLGALKCSASDLDTPFSKLWPDDQEDPIDHIDDACRERKCYPLSRQQLRQRLRGKKVNSLRDFIRYV